MARSTVRGVAPVALLACLSLVACGTTTPPPTPPTIDTTEPAPRGAAPAPTQQAPTGTAPTFSPCGREEADASRTNLRPSALDGADRDLAGSWSEYIPDGHLAVEAATALDIQDGVLGAGAGYYAAIGSPEVTARVAEETVRDAPVSLSVLDSPSSGRRVAFVEIRLSPESPVSWTREPDLGIGTDGGDGGFLTQSAIPDAAPDDTEVVEAFIAAFFPDPDDVSTWHQCLERSSGGRVDGVLFSTGWGDGYYPTYLGKDAAGDVVSVVSFGGVVPWNLSGLPGTPPPADEVGP